MSSTEPPTGPTPPYGDGSTPPPPPPPPAGGQYGTPPPPAPSYGSEPQYGAPQYGTPPPPAPGYAGTRPGELLDRFLARLIDAVILIVVGFVIGLILAAVLIGSGGSDGISLLVGVVGAVISAAINLGYFAFLESKNGQTLGKMVMKLKVVGPDGQSHPTMEQAVRRNLYQGYAILGVVPLLGGFIGFLAYIGACIFVAVGINSDAARRQHWFDTFAGGTQVLKIG